MSDRLRRKRPSNEELSEGSAGDNEEIPVDITSEGEGGHEADDSEYESVDSETELKDDEVDLEDGEVIHESLNNEDSFSGGERQRGDGEESNEAPEKPLDDDEDRRNPQYIPKRGVFYEHDDRTSEKQEGEKEGPPPKPETRKKKLWKDDDKWMHDKFVDGEQNPKSRDELISVYGYDIRNEESAPRARRRRRYGRGPNKYTRNWEDEEAYRKASVSTVTAGKDGENPFRGRGRGGRGRGGRPGYNMHDDRNIEKEESNWEFAEYRNDTFVVRNKGYWSTRQENERNSYEGRGHGRNDNEENFPPLKATNQNEEEGFAGRGGRREEDGPRKMSPRKPPTQRWERQDSNRSSDKSEGILPAKGRGRGRGVRPNKGAPVKEVRPGRRPSKEDEQQLAQDINSLSIEGKKPGTVNRGTAQGVPPRLQDGGSSRPKRYSSQRQRTGADNYSAVPAQQQQQYYESSGQQGFQSNGVYNNENNGNNPPASPQQMMMPAVPPPQAMHTGTRIFPPPPPNAPPFIGAPPFPAAPPPPGTIQYPPPGPPPPAGPVSFQAFPVPGPAPQEIYSNGVAYYNTQSQALPRTPPMKRTKAPIPIVPPPEKPKDSSLEPQPDSPPPPAEVQVLS